MVAIGEIMLMVVTKFFAASMRSAGVSPKFSPPSESL
ncbi:hypothetical protein SRABI70_04856 [Pseudomonas sp. Bi70]|nr:hypothetical protein SRABI70_04856 [Pseudomonas sp. Bi70]